MLLLLVLLLLLLLLPVFFDIVGVTFNVNVYVAVFDYDDVFVAVEAVFLLMYMLLLLLLRYSCCCCGLCWCSRCFMHLLLL